jgi:hypothetical protein
MPVISDTIAAHGAKLPDGSTTHDAAVYYAGWEEIQDKLTLLFGAKCWTDGMFSGMYFQSPKEFVFQEGNVGETEYSYKPGFRMSLWAGLRLLGYPI